MGECFIQGKDGGFGQISGQSITAKPEDVVPVEVELGRDIAQFSFVPWDPMDSDVLEVHRHLVSWSDKAKWPRDITRT